MSVLTPITWQCRECGERLPALATADQLAEFDRIAPRTANGVYPGLCRAHEGILLPIRVAVRKEDPRG